ncbi:MAG: DUF63 family protein [Candidatus Methanoperedens sp.]|nr:DUF63 family protein [Candidatus Methanoperedens sp.]
MVNNLLDYIVRSATDVETYNPINTLLFGLLFAVGILFVYAYIINRFGLRIDGRFLFAASMWAFFAMSIRLLHDTGFTDSVWFITPYVTLIDFSLAISLLFLSIYIQRIKKIDYWKTWGTSGAILGIIVLSLSTLSNWEGFGLVVILWTASLLILVGARKIFPNFLTWWNIGVLETQLMDAAGSFAGITFFGFSEEHVLGGAAIKYAESIGLTLFGSGSWVMFLLKLVVLVPVLYYIDRYPGDINEKKYIKTVIFVLGLAIGLRNGFNILILKA